MDLKIGLLVANIALVVLLGGIAATADLGPVVLALFAIIAAASLVVAARISWHWWRP